MRGPARDNPGIVPTDETGKDGKPLAGQRKQ